MAEIRHIRQKIAEIAQRENSVELSEIQWVVDHLGANGYDISTRRNAHQYLFRVGSKRFGICHHNPGRKEVKRCYVREFLDKMAELGLYEP